MMTYQGHLPPERRSTTDVDFRSGVSGHLPPTHAISLPSNNNTLQVHIPQTAPGIRHHPYVNDSEAYMKLTGYSGSPPHGQAGVPLPSPALTMSPNISQVAAGGNHSHQQHDGSGDGPSILRSALTKPKPQQQPAAAYSCPTPCTLTHGPLLASKVPLTAIRSEPVGGITVEEAGEQSVPNAHNKPKYNFEAIKNYPPFRDAYNGAMARRRSKSFGQGARHRSSSESGPFTFAPTDRSSQSAINSIKCSKCNQVLTSKCLVNRCQSVSEQTKCKICGRELTTKCLLANCQS